MIDLIQLIIGCVGAAIVAWLFLFTGTGKKRAQEGAGESLWESARANQVEKVRDLCAKWECDSSILNWTHSEWEGSTPLQSACAWDNAECVAILARTRGVDINRGSKVGWTALFLAAINGLPEIAKILLTVKDIDKNKAPTSGVYKGKTPRMIAMDNPFRKDGCAGVAKLLEEAGCE